MTELITGNSVSVQPHPTFAISTKTAEDLVRSPLVANPATQGDAVNYLQEVAGYMEVTSPNDAANNVNLPQLTLPKTFLSLEEIFAALDKVNKRSMSSLRAHLEEIEQDKQAKQAEAERRWLEFNQTYTKLSTTQAEFDKVIEVSTNLYANGEPTQAELDHAAQLADDALINAINVIDELDAGVERLLAFGNPKAVDTLRETKVKLSVLNECRLIVQESQRTNKRIFLQERFDLFKEVQEAIQAKLEIQIQDFKKAEEQQKKALTATKWVGAIVSFAVILITGGTATPILSAIGASVLVADLATDGKVTEAVFEPVMGVLLKGVEDLGKLIADDMKEKGRSPEHADTIGLVVAMVIGAIAAAGVVAAASLAGGTATGKAITDKLSAGFAALMKKLDSFAITKLISAPSRFLNNLIESAIEFVFGKGISAEARKAVAQRAFNWGVTLGTIGGSVSTTIGSVAGQEAKHVTADYDFIATIQGNIADEINTLANTHAEHIRNQDKALKDISENIAHMVRTNSSIIRNVSV